MKSKRWEARRDTFFASHSRICAACRDRGSHLHHKTYERLGNERDSDLVVLCEWCHNKLHKDHALAGHPNLYEFSMKWIYHNSGLAKKVKRKQTRKRPTKPKLEKPCVIDRGRLQPDPNSYWEQKKRKLGIE